MESVEPQLVEFGRLGMRDWAQLVGSETRPFGEESAGIEFRPKDHHIGARDEHGRLIASGGWSIVNVEVEGHGTFEVIGAGALIVRPESRGGSLAFEVMARVIEITDLLKPAHMMLFCEPRLERLYRRFQNCETITDPVWVDQPSGPTLLPLRAMWRSSPTDASVTWPAGTVRVDGLPF